MLHAGSNLRLLHIFRQDQRLFELGVVELATQVVSLLIVSSLLLFLLHLDNEVTILVDVHGEVLLLQAWGSKLHDILVVILNHVDGWCCSIGTRHEIVVEKVVEHGRQPSISVNHLSHNLYLHFYFKLLFVCNVSELIAALTSYIATSMPQHKYMSQCQNAKTK